MSFLASAHVSANRFVSLLKNHIPIRCLLLLSCMGINPVLAAGECSLSPISTQTQYGQGGAALVFSFTLIENGGCNAESGDVKIIADPTESAQLEQTFWSTGVNKPTSVSLKLRGNIGGQMEITVNCKNCAPANTVLPLTVSLTKSSAGITDELVDWKQTGGPTIANIDPVTGKSTDLNGENQIDFNAGINGIYTVRATVCDPADTRFCTPLIVDFTIDFGATGPGQRSGHRHRNTRPNVDRFANRREVHLQSQHGLGCPHSPLPSRMGA